MNYDQVYAPGYDFVLVPTLAVNEVPAQHDFTTTDTLTENAETYPLGMLMGYLHSTVHTPWGGVPS